MAGQFAAQKRIAGGRSGGGFSGTWSGRQSNGTESSTTKHTNHPKEARMNADEQPFKDTESRTALRDMFAAAALQGLVASNFYDRYKPIWKLDEIKDSIPKVAAMIAYQYADAMLDYREISKP